MWLQIHEMLYIEKGGEAQIEGELGAYNPLVPKGSELIATLMFEIDEPRRSEREFGRLAGGERSVVLRVAGETVRSMPEEEVERTRADGRTSSVHFLHFPFSTGQIRAFRAPGARVVVEIGHPNYAHMAVMPEKVRQSLAQDFD